MFKLNPEFIEQYANKQPNLSPLGQVVYARTYSRIKEDGNSELFCDTLRRVVEGTFTHLKRHIQTVGSNWNEERGQRKAQEMFRRMWDLKFMPPGRGLWSMGSPIVEKIGGAPLNNCAMISTACLEDVGQFASPFCNLMDYSMLGVGCGFDTRGAGRVVIREPNCTKIPYVVEDTREGWVNLIRRILLSYVGLAELPEEIDYSQVRPEGTPIKGFGGVASGPGPLHKLTTDIQDILDPIIDKPITSTAIVDIMNVIGKCVVSGNVRRSAEIAIGHWTDKDFIALKDDKEKVMEYRWSSNNTVNIDGCRDLGPIVEHTVTRGEPGFFFQENARKYGRLIDPPTWVDRDCVGLNPCGEQTLHHMELCTLVHTFPTNHESLQDYLITLKYAYLYAKTVTTIMTHNKQTNEVMSRNRRIGTSMAGISEMYSRLGLQECIRWWDNSYRYLRLLDEDYSTWMKIPRSIKITTMQPGGSVPLMIGVEGSMKFPTSPFYYRTVRLDRTSPLIPQLEKAGFKCEPDKYTPRSTVVYFPVQSRATVYASEVSLWEQMQLMVALQTYWSDNAVSATITFKPHEHNDIGRALEVYRDKLKSISFLPYSEHDYEQAPYIPITSEEYSSSSRDLKLDLNQNSHEIVAEEKFCQGDKCLL